MEKSLQFIRQLATDFKANEKAFLSPTYQESQVRQDFIDKFFTALGWDVTHTTQKNPYEQEVKIENKVTTQGSQRRADYAFFVAPNYRDVKFFAEAKKPAHNLANADYYHQTIRYGWNAGTPIAILTDFEGFHILDCRYKPDIGNALNRKLKYFHYSDYADEEKFKEIFFLFGREAVANGSIEKFAADLPKPKSKTLRGFRTLEGLKTVDEAFLEQLDEYRNTLAKAFKKENQELDGEELTEAVQRTLDRLVFIRFLEDKGIEEPEIIGFTSPPARGRIKEGVVWNKFISLCKRLEPKYNGLIFKPHRILDGKDFHPPNDKAFADICAELADPSSPYDFDKIPISILGSIYERFLGKVVHATAKQVKVEPKPEVRKAGGVYYTPEYIVRYIVNETVGRLLNSTPSQSPPIRGRSSEGTEGVQDSIGKTPDEIAKMSFADIACGSGSFLIEVYNQLLEYHERWYNAHRDKAKKDDVYERDGRLHLSLKKKKEILTNNVYGVDIDFQATEVTQLSLYLKLLENVTNSETHQLGMFKETILPNLNNNIVCGNSLIGTDIYDGDLFESQNLVKVRNLDKVEQTDKLRPMNFEDAFPKIMRKGGFDAVVGNPPYRMIQPHNTETGVIEYMRTHFVAAEFKVDLFHLFLQQAINTLKNKGMLGYIVPTTILNNVYVENLRKWILNQCAIENISVAKDKVFADADVHTSVLVFRKEILKDQRDMNEIRTSVDLNETFAKNPIFNSRTIQNSFFELSGLVWNVLVNTKNISLIRKLNQNKPLKDLAYINRGLITGDREKYFSPTQKNKEFVPIIGGGDVHRYYTNSPSEYVLFKKPTTAGGCWDKEVHFVAHKLVIRQIGTRPTASILKEPIAVTGNIFTAICENITDEIFILAILNSSLAAFYWRVMFNDFKNSFPQVTIFSLSQLPIRTINFDDVKDKSRHDNIVKLVEQMLEAKQKLQTAKTDGKTNRLELLCASLDRKIDEAVYELYDLTEEEIKIVEGRQ